MRNLVCWNYKPKEGVHERKKVGKYCSRGLNLILVQLYLLHSEPFNEITTNITTKVFENE